MRMTIATVAAMSTLALAACNQPGDTASAPAAADTAIDAVAIDKNAPPPAPAVQAPRPTRAPTPAPDPAPQVDEPSAHSGGLTAGPSPEVRDAAKEKAESTNLHPAG